MFGRARSASSGACKRPSAGDRRTGGFLGDLTESKGRSNVRHSSQGSLVNTRGTRLRNLAEDAQTEKVSRAKGTREATDRHNISSTDITTEAVSGAKESKKPMKSGLKSARTSSESKSEAFVETPRNVSFADLPLQDSGGLDVPKNEETCSERAESTRCAVVSDPLPKTSFLAADTHKTLLAKLLEPTGLSAEETEQNLKVASPASAGEWNGGLKLDQIQNCSACLSKNELAGAESLDDQQCPDTSQRNCHRLCAEDDLQRSSALSSSRHSPRRQCVEHSDVAKTRNGELVSSELADQTPSSGRVVVPPCAPCRMVHVLSPSRSAAGAALGTGKCASHRGGIQTPRGPAACWRADAATGATSALFGEFSRSIGVPQMGLRTESKCKTDLKAPPLLMPRHHPARQQDMTPTRRTTLVSPSRASSPSSGYVLPQFSWKVAQGHQTPTHPLAGPVIMRLRSSTPVPGRQCVRTSSPDSRLSRPHSNPASARMRVHSPDVFREAEQMYGRRPAVFMNTLVY